MQTHNILSYANPVHIYFASGRYIDAIKNVIGSTKGSVAIFYGQGAMKKMGIINQIKAALSNCEIVEYGNIPENPDIMDIAAINQRYFRTDWIIGIGGGSVLDVAKIVAFMAPQKEDIWRFLNQKNEKPTQNGISFIAIPTTSGTGSEVTPWATIWDHKQKKKYSLSNMKMYAKFAIIDPMLTLSLPASITANTGFDAFSHAMEAFWSKYSNPVSDILAIEAIRLLLAHLDLAIDDLSNLSHREALARASLLAGLAFSNTKTTAVHAVSYPMTLNYGLPHGVACSLTLPEFWLYNVPSMDAAKVNQLLSVIHEKNPDAFAIRMRLLAKRIGLPITLSEAGIPEEGLDIILNEGFHPERVINNPRGLGINDLRKILMRIK